MSKRTDAELINILNSPSGDYQQAALEAAKRVIDSRNLSQEQITTAKLEIEQKQTVVEAKANEPLNVFVKILSFIFPGALLLMFAGTFKADGYERKGREMVRWTFYGWAFYGSVIILMIIITYFSIH